MAEGCPAREALEAFAAGSHSERERTDMEAHLAQCLSCAEELEKLTRAQLDFLIGDRDTTAAPGSAASPLLDTVMRRAVGSGGSSGRLDPRRVLELLDPPATEGSLGIFADYDISEIVGVGGMGVVFKARDRTLNRVVAVKLISPAGIDDEAFAARFLDEARAVAAIHHDNIVTVHHAGMTKDLAYLVMPYHAEGTLERWLARAPKLTPKEVARVGLQLARALAATHARGILHRDIKPSNVLLEDGLKRVRLADFGLARSPGSAPTATKAIKPARASEGPARRTIAGTPNYMSPEQARGESFTVRSDLFGLGAVLYQLAVGRTLYAGESSEEVLQAAAQGNHPSVREGASNVPAGLATTIDRLLEKRPEDRFASANEVVAVLERFLSEGQRLRLRMKLAAIGLLAACLALSVIILALDWSGRTNVVNSLLCHSNGNECYIRGRFGTYSSLADAVVAARANEIVEARFSGERLTGPFRVGGKPLTIRAAEGFMPILVATNNGQPMILVDAPLTLEGLTLWRRAPQIRVVPLISVEEAPLHLLNCRIIRTRFQGQNVLVRGGLRELPATDLQRYFPVIAVQHGSECYLRNCLVAGTQATAIGVRASTNQPARVEAENNLFVVDRTFLMKPEAETRANLKFSHSVLLTGALLDLDESGPVTGISLFLEDCIVDRNHGALLRLNQGHEGALLRALEWKETNVVYAGSGLFAISRRRRTLDSEADWNALLRLGAGSHRLIDRQVFPETCARSGLALNATDLDAEVLQAANSSQTRFAPRFIGEGSSYDAFRKADVYRDWRRQVRARVREWEGRQVVFPGTGRE